MTTAAAAKIFLEIEKIGPIQTPKFNWMGGKSVASIAATAKIFLEKRKVCQIQTP